MRSLLRASLFGLAFLFSQELFLSNFALARHTASHCCMCPSCYSWCWCGGQANCPKCHSIEDTSILAVSYGLPTDIRQIILSSRPLRVIDAESVEKVMTIVSANRLYERSAIQLIDQLEDHMRFRCLRFVSFWDDLAASRIPA